MFSKGAYQFYLISFYSYFKHTITVILAWLSSIALGSRWFVLCISVYCVRGFGIGIFTMEISVCGFHLKLSFGAFWCEFGSYITFPLTNPEKKKKYHLTLEVGVFLLLSGSE